MTRVMPGRRAVVGLAVLAALVVAGIWMPLSAEAKPPHAGPPEHAGGPGNSGGGAFVERGFTCTQDQGDGVSVIEGEGKSYVVTPSGNRSMVCVTDGGEIPEGSQGAQHIDYESTGGGQCSLADVRDPDDTTTTDRWRSIVTPSGKSIMICHLN